MRIAIVTHFFYPSVGGTEEVAQILAVEFAKLGHTVKIVTSTRMPEGGIPFPFEVIRRPGPLELWRALRWSEVVLHNNLCLQMAWPLLLLRRPWVVAHHIWTRRMNGRRGFRDRLKLLAIRFARNVAVSRAIAADLPVPASVIGNPYRDDVFFQMDGATRSKPLLFVGRLVLGKGVEILLEALRILETKGVSIPLTVVGDGAQRGRLESLAAGLPVEFVGRKAPAELARVYNEHWVLAVPSMWDEPFGLVALEGIACGCAVIGSDDGGLPEAIGPCGRIFPKGDAKALAESVRAGLAGRCSLFVGRRPSTINDHLSKHKAQAVARAYLDILEEARVSSKL